MVDASPTPRDLTIPNAAGPAIRAWLWTQERPKGVLVVSHGLGEHSGCYRHVAENLGPRLEIDVLAFDYRGHGRGAGGRGVVHRYEELVDDLQAVVDWVTAERPDQPRFLLGHSNGGQVVMRLLLQKPDLDGAILSNPALRLAVRVPAYKRLIGETLRRLAPSVTLSAEVNDGQMTRDPLMLAGRGDDPLRHSRISAPLFFGLVDGGVEIAARALEIQTPILMLLGEQDPVIDAEFSRQVFDRLGAAGKALRTYPDALHEPLNDLCRAHVLDDVASWLQPRLAIN
jgi:alpha-beta hydrolase superfamily lysophospholipase